MDSKEQDRTLRIGAVYRYSRPYDPEPYKIGNELNFFHHTFTEGQKAMALLEKGINPIATVEANGARRVPAILVSSSPHKAGSDSTPWQDHFNPDEGHVRYFGDNKKSGADPASSPGNKALLQQFKLQFSSDSSDRAAASPIMFFKRVHRNNAAKGYLEFQGYGVIHKIEIVTQRGENGEDFTNYAFDFILFGLTQERQLFPWKWISARRDARLSDNDCAKLAPAAWRTWVEKGHASVEQLRRRVIKELIIPKEQQRPKTNESMKVLDEIYRHYDGKKHHFEALAELVVERIIKAGGAQYHKGWVTAKSGDGGADFVGRVDIGTDFSRAKIVLLGQAKCEKYDTTTNGLHIARTVARLRRGWIGAYVTTSFFSDKVQAEILTDKYPLILVNGGRLADEVRAICIEKKCPVQELLAEVDSLYNGRVRHRDPEEIVYDVSWDSISPVDPRLNERADPYRQH